jgi:putative ABC transport system permease protein
MNTLLQDLRYGLRMLAKNPGFTAVAVVTLALGIGANTAIFSLVNAVLLRPIAGIASPEGLVQLGRRHLKNGAWIDFDTISYPNYKDYRDRNHVFERLAAFRNLAADLSADARVERIEGAVVTGNYFQALDVKAALGRTFLPEEDEVPGSHPVAVISYGLWQRRFGGDRNLLGKTIRINSHSFVLVGVTPQGFKGTQLDQPVDTWVPMAMASEIVPPFLKGWTDVRQANWLQAVGRLRPGVSLKQAQADLSTLARRLEEEYPTDDKNVGVTLDPHLGLWPGDRAEVVNFAGLLIVVVGLVLLISCANVAGVLLAKAAGRRKEVAVRLALGAGRVRVIRQLLVESTLLGLAAGAAALMVTFWTGDLLSASWLARVFPHLDLEPDVRVFAFTLIVSALTSLVFGLAPAWTLSKPDLVPALRDAPPTMRLGKSRLRSAMVVGQIALCLLLLVAAGLVVRTLLRLQSIDPGFEVRNILDVSLDVGPEGYDESRGRLFYGQLLEKIEALPGVRSACLTITPPLNSSQWGTGIAIEGRENPAEQPWLPVHYAGVTPGYFQTLGIPLIGGRGFSDRDDPGGAVVGIINQTMARRFWPGENPIGKRFRLRGNKAYVQVVGVARDIKMRELNEAPQPFVYFPLAQHYESEVALLVRTHLDPMSLLGAVEREVHSLDKNLPLVKPQTLAQHVEASLGQQRLAAALISLFGLLALTLAAVGLYGAIAHSVSQRKHEIGIRMALGAGRADVLRLVVGQGLLLNVIGTAIGALAALGLTRFLSSLLYGVRPTDPATFLAVAIFLGGVSLLASYIPARRATKVDPMVALRYE